MRSFSVGMFAGAMFSLAVATGAAIVLPIDGSDPVGKTQVDLLTPRDSGFNAGIQPSEPILPEVDDAVTTEVAAQPEFDVISPSLPTADTTSVAEPTEIGAILMPQNDPGDEQISMTTPATEGSPTVPSPTLNMPLSQPDGADIQIPTSPEAVVDAPVTEVATLPENPVADAATETAVAPESSKTALTSPSDGDLPQIDETPEVETLADETQPDAGNEGAVAALPEEPAVAAEPALRRNAIAFDNPENKPLISVILLDVGDAGLDAVTLATFNFPLTFAFDLTIPGSEERAQYLHAAGFEVAFLTPVELAIVQGPAGQSAFRALLGGLPDSVVILDNPSQPFQANATLTERIIQTASATGHALVTYDQGLNTAQRAAQRAGVKGVAIFRELDAENEPSVVIQRYLDRAAFKAGQDGRVVMFGRTYPETVKGIFSWERSQRARGVSFAPISAAVLQSGI